MKMYSLQQLLLYINSLCFFFMMPSLVQSGAIDTWEDECDVYTPDNFVNITVALHNFYRAHVYPPAADMRKMVAVYVCVANGMTTKLAVSYIALFNIFSKLGCIRIVGV